MVKIQRHKELCEGIHAIYEAKNADYGDSFGKTFELLGIISAVTRITDKYNRMVQLAIGHDQRVKDESIKDTLIDMANYCIMTVMEIEKQEEANGQR